MSISQTVRNSVIALSCLASGYAFAGGPDVPPAPTSMMYFGAGAAYTAIQSNPTFNGDVNGVSVGGANGRATFENQINPFIQLGYLNQFDANWLAGVRLDYTYLNAQNSLVGSLYQLQYNHLLKLLFQGGMKVTQNSTFLLGVGPNVMSTDLAVGTGSVGGTVLDGSHWSWGFTGALDYVYNFTDAFFLDAGYSYTYNYVNQKYSNYADPASTLGENGGISANVATAAVQQFTTSLNYAFSL